MRRLRPRPRQRPAERSPPATLHTRCLVRRRRLASTPASQRVEGHCSCRKSSAVARRSGWRTGITASTCAPDMRAVEVERSRICRQRGLQLPVVRPPLVGSTPTAARICIGATLRVSHGCRPRGVLVGIEAADGISQGELVGVHVKGDPPDLQTVDSRRFEDRDRRRGVHYDSAGTAPACSGRCSERGADASGTACTGSTAAPGTTCGCTSASPCPSAGHASLTPQIVVSDAYP